jgi:hypothetical protein
MRTERYPDQVYKELILNKPSSSWISNAGLGLYRMQPSTRAAAFQLGGGLPGMQGESATTDGLRSSPLGCCLLTLAR